MKRLLTTLLLSAGIMFGAYANDIYVTQSGDDLDLDITQDGQNNQVGNSTTSSSVIGASATIDIDQVGNSNVLKFDVNGANYTCLLYTSPSPRDLSTSRMPSSA